MAAGLGEPRALVHLLIACGIYFVASLPTALRQARGIEADDPVSAAIAAHLFAWGALAPLAAYGLAALVHLAARAFGAQGGFLAARSAFFWSALALAPFAVLAALVGVGAELAAPRVLPWIGWLDYAGFVLWLWVFAGSLAVAEGFGRTGRVAVVIAAGFAGVAGLLAALAGGGAA